jgi:RNA recognition motif-containing protein
MGTRLYVGNLSFNSTEDGLRQAFSQAGAVKDCRLMIDKFTNKSRGFAFIEMETQADANKAIEMFNGKDLDGRSLKVNEAKPLEDRPRREGGGGGGGGDRRDSRGPRRDY